MQTARLKLPNADFKCRNGMVIRLARPSDVDAIMRLNPQYPTDEAAETRVDLQAERQHLNHHIRSINSSYSGKSNAFFVAEKDGEIVGLKQISTPEEGKNTKYFNSPYLETQTAVAPKFEGNGIGSALWAASCAWLMANRVNDFVTLTPAEFGKGILYMERSLGCKRIASHNDLYMHEVKTAGVLSHLERKGLLSDFGMTGIVSHYQDYFAKTEEYKEHAAEIDFL